MLFCVGDFFASDDDEEWPKVVSGEVKGNRNQEHWFLYLLIIASKFQNVDD